MVMEPKKALELVDDPMTIIDAIYKRLAIRNYAPNCIDEANSLATKGQS